jgi:hypothetical protein
MDATQRAVLMQRWNVVQHELLPELRDEVGTLSPKLEKLIHTLEWVRIEEFVAAGGCGVGRPPHERAWLANGFVAKAVLGLSTTAALVERLAIDRALRRICGFAPCRKLPSQATFSRAFAEFAQGKLAERVHAALIKAQLGQALIGHLSRDATAIEARERPARPREAVTAPAPQAAMFPAQAPGATRAPGRRDRGTKCNAQGYKVSWNGYKRHLDTADCGVPIAALLSSASMHDSRAAIPLSLMSAARVTHLYDVMDAAYCSLDLHEHSRSLNHVPLIEHNRRGGEKVEFDPADALRYHERTAAERTNARLKDEFGARHVQVRGHTKIMGHLMFGVLALSADQLMRLRC